MIRFILTGRGKLQAALGVIVAVIAAVVWIGVYANTRECEAKGGKRLRGALEGFQCYDARTLAVLP